MRFGVWVAGGNAHKEAFREIAETVHCALLALGHSSILALATPPRFWQDCDRVVVLGSNLLPAGFYQQNAILYNFEQAGSPWFTKGPLLELMRRHRVWDYSERNIAWLGERGIEARHVPLGYVPELTRIDRNREQSADVLFYGSYNERRKKILQQLAAAGLRVEMLKLGTYGRARDEAIARAKLVINIHFYETKIFEMARVSYLLANRVPVVSEDSVDVPEKLDSISSISFAPYSELVDRCRVVAFDEVARKILSTRGFEAFSAGYPMTEILRGAAGAL